MFVHYLLVRKCFDIVELVKGKMQEKRYRDEFRGILLADLIMLRFHLTDKVELTFPQPISCLAIVS